MSSVERRGTIHLCQTVLFSVNSVRDYIDLRCYVVLFSIEQLCSRSFRIYKKNISFTRIAFSGVLFFHYIDYHSRIYNLRQENEWV